MKAIIILAALVLVCSAASAQPGKHFAIKVVDEETGRGVPAVELKTTNHQRYVTDSAGLVAFYEPGMMNTDVHFMVKSHGYEFKKDSFGYAGVALKTIEGGSAEIRIKRKNIAERLYRITGQGIYSDTVLLGRKPPLANPVINGLVVGQDSVLSEVYKGKVFWFWGDTSKVAYPLGNFHASGATSLLPSSGGLDPDVGVDLTYFVDDKGFSRGVAKLPEIAKSGPVWLGGLLTLPDENKRESLYAMYSNVDNEMHSKAIGIAKWDDEKEQFDSVRQFPPDVPIRPSGHTFRVMHNGVEYIYYTPVTRVRADIAHLLDPTAYEAYTCAKAGSRLSNLEIDRTPEGKPNFGWKRNTPALLPAEEAKQIKEGKLKAEEALFRIRDCDTGKEVLYHGSSIAWNAYRKRWTMILSEIFGTSFLGEVWYLEADTPLGPWVYARKIITHDDYTFYNPRHHPFFDKDGGRTVFFDGTYTTSFSGCKDPTPRYEYNQIMYKLDLSSPRLALPVPIYALADGRFAASPGVPKSESNPAIAFFASDMPGIDTVPVYQQGGRLTVGSKTTKGTPVFYALPADTAKPPATTTPLYEFTRADGRRAYSTDANWSRSGFTRSAKPLCLVWKNPMTQRIPLHVYKPKS